MTKNIDHHVWKAYYVRDHWDDPSEEILATTKEKAMELVAEDADVPNAGWEKNEQVDYPLYQLHRTTHHVVTVVRVPVYGDTDVGEGQGTMTANQTYQLGDLQPDYEGLRVPECPNPDCDLGGFTLDTSGECPHCGLEYELEVQFDLGEVDER